MQFPKHFQRVRDLKEAMKVAFAVESTDEGLSSEDQALLDKVAATVVARRMASPAMLFLESIGPMNFLGSQALHALTPILNLACHAREIERAAYLLERRDAIPRLLALIEAKSAAVPTSP
jgi:hypothetical protein